jgi:lipopolysaccharide O-acetyltransferase
MSLPGFVGLYAWWLRARAKLFTHLCRGDFFRLGTRSTIEPPARLVGVQRIEIGMRVFIGGHSWLEVIPGRVPHPPPTIRIGDGTSISGFCTITAARSVVIERDVLIARYAYISDHTHATASADRPIKLQGITKIAPVHIGEGAWLGQNVVVCPGVTIGRNAVIGANSVVRDDVPDFSVAVGAPARVVRSNAPQTVR